MDKTDRSAATVRKASRIARRMASRCAKSQRFLLARDIGEGKDADVGRRTGDAATERVSYRILSVAISSRPFDAVPI